MALDNDRNTPERDGRAVAFNVAANAKIFAGSLVAVNAEGFAVPGSNTDGLKGIGRAEDYVDNTGGSDGDDEIMVKKGVFKFDNDVTLPVTAADLNGDCYIKDDGTVRAKDTGASAPNPIAGTVFSIEDDGVWVKF